MNTVQGTDLKLADVVRLGTEKFSDAIVCQIKDGEVTLRRPYMQNADFSHTGGVITYIGLEEFKVSANQTFQLLQRGGPLR